MPYARRKIKNILKNTQANSLGIVLCGAQLGEYGGLFDSDLNIWNETYKCNVLGNLAVIKACEDIIKSGVKTRIVFFSGGGAANSNNTEFSGYSLSKTAVVREVENLSVEFSKINKNASIIALAPGAVQTDMLSKVISCGGNIKTKTDIDEPTQFVFKFLNDEFQSQKMNGMFVHVRDDLSKIDFDNKELFKLRRIE